MASTNRTGRVSAIDYEAGTYEVTYTDRGKSVTRKINAVSNGEYKMPNIGDVVSVLHNSNGTAAGVTVGTVWNQKNKPAEGFQGLYRKELGTQPGQAFERYDANTGAYKLHADGAAGRECGAIYDSAAGKIQIKSSGGEVVIEAGGATITIGAGGDISIASPSKITLTAPEISAEIAGGDITVDGASLVNHTHTVPGVGETTAPNK